MEALGANEAMNQGTSGFNYSVICKSMPKLEKPSSNSNIRDTMRKVPLIFVTLLAVLLSACGAAQPTNNSTTSGVPTVLANHVIPGRSGTKCGWHRLQVGIFIPWESIPTNTNRHRRMCKAFHSQVLIVNGIGYEFWLQKTLDGVGETGRSLPLRPAWTPLSDLSGTEAAGDPHMWLDVSKAISYVNNYRDGLTQADPGGKEIYSQNAAAYITKLNGLDQWIKDQVSKILPTSAVWSQPRQPGILSRRPMVSPLWEPSSPASPPTALALSATNGKSDPNHQNRAAPPLFSSRRV